MKFVAVYQPIVNVQEDGTVDIDFSDSFQHIVDEDGNVIPEYSPSVPLRIVSGEIMDDILGLKGGEAAPPTWKQVRNLARYLKRQERNKP